MKFDPFLLFFIVFVFFILPSILKKILTAKKTKTESGRMTESKTTTVSGTKTGFGAKITSGKTKSLKTGEKSPSILGKIILQVRQFMKEAQKQAQLQKQLQQQKQLNRRQTQPQQELTEQEKQPGPDQTIWEILAEKTDDNFDDSLIISPKNESKHTGPAKEPMENQYTPSKKSQTEKAEQPFDRGQSQLTDSFIPEQADLLPVTGKRYRFKTDPLQNAVIWSEILSRPVALKKNS